MIDMIMIAALLMLGVAVLVFLVTRLWKPTTVQQDFPPDPDLVDGDVSERAKLTWAAHVAVQELDAAVLMESPEDVQRRLILAITHTNTLADHLRAERASNDV